MISTHTPLAGRDCGYDDYGDFEVKFQLTRPLRGATSSSVFNGSYSKFQLTRPLRGATAERFFQSLAVAISTHTPLAGRDG